MEKERWEVKGSLNIQDKKLKLPSDKSHVECVAILKFCIRAPKVEKGRRDTHLFLAVIFEKISLGARSGILKESSWGCSYHV